MSHAPAVAPEPGAGFEPFSLDPKILTAVARLGFETPTPIQARTIPALLEGRDVIGRARTGSGKTAAFGLPLLEKVKDAPKGVKALVLTPTRELALQVTEALRGFARGLNVRVATIYGGAAYRPQFEALSRGVPIVVGTPGRVIDHLERGTLDLSGLQLLVLDEADEMLRMGFIEDVQRVLMTAPKGRQVALFSATMPPAIRKVAEAHLSDPLEIQVESGALTTEHIEQRGVLVPHRFKLDALMRILAAEDRGATLIFARTRAGCAAASDALSARGMFADALHGDLSQAARERVLGRLRSGALDILVATDVASRGIDVEHITHVINLDLPDEDESYVHRIGRTGRAGRKGVAISLVTPRESYRMRALQKALRVKITKVQVPTDADIDRRRRAKLLERIEAALAADPSPAAEAMVEGLCSGGASNDAQKVAVAAIRLLAAEAGVDLSGSVSDAPPSWARSKERIASDRRDRHPTSTGDEVELFLPVGKVRGVRPADLVGALTNDLGVDRTQIGRITILPHKTFLRVHSEVGAKILGGSGKLNVRGREVPVSRAKTRRDEGGGRPPPRRPERGRRPQPHRKGGKPGGNRRFKPKKR